MTRRHYESLAQTAQRTHVSVRTLRRWIAQGRLNAYRAGPRLLRIDPEEVDAMMKPSLRTGPSRSGPLG
jgi:excisionase family DNA binding protein